MYVQKYYKVIRVIKDGDGGATPLYIENVSDSDGEFKLYKNGSPTTPNLIYRIGDNGEWFQYDVATLPSITVPSGSKIYFRGDNVNGFNQSSNINYYKFNFSQNYNIGGYITSLLALDNFNTITDIPQYSFSYLFNNQSNLLNAKDLDTDNIIKVGQYGFTYCFSQCSNLTTAPQFNNLYFINNGCFVSCFSQCSNLTTAPQFNNLTTVRSHGFQFCFSQCSNLTTAPQFKNLTTINDYGFRRCFEDCTSLSVVYAPSIPTWNTSNFDNWLNKVSLTGVMYKPANLTIPTGTSGVPEGWTTVDY